VIQFTINSHQRGKAETATSRDKQTKKQTKEDIMQNGLSQELPKNESEGRKLNVVRGKFALRVEEGAEGAEPRNLTRGDNEGKEVWELLYPTLTGTITSGQVKDLTYGPAPEIDIDCGGESYTVQFGWDDKMFSALVTRLPNIDRGIPVSLSLVPHKTKKTSKGNPVVNLFVTQNGKRVDDYYVKWSKDENKKNIATLLHGLPEVEEFHGVYDFKNRAKFYLGVFEEYFKGDGEMYTMPDADTIDDAPKDPVYNTVDTKPPAVDPAAAEQGVVDRMLEDDEPDDSDNLPF